NLVESEAVRRVGKSPLRQRARPPAGSSTNRTGWAREAGASSPGGDRAEQIGPTRLRPTTGLASVALRRDCDRRDRPRSGDLSSGRTEGSKGVTARRAG